MEELPIAISTYFQSRNTDIEEVISNKKFKPAKYKPTDAESVVFEIIGLITIALGILLVFFYFK